MTEQSIAAARASVMVYDDTMKKWVPSGSSSGLSKVHIYQHLANATFRVVGRKLGDHEVVINTSIFKGLKYNQATPTFHQWRDKNQVHGLNFSSRDDAEAFAQAMLRTLDLVNQTGASPRPPPPPPMNLQPVYQSIPGEIDCNNIETQKWLDSDSGRITHQIQYTSNAVMGQQQANGPQSNSTGSPNNTLHRSAAPPNCAPPAPPPPPAQPNMAAAPPPPPPPPPPPGPGLPPCPPPMPSSGGPPPPPVPPAFAGPPCPPPPPGSLQQKPNAANVSLASALANAKLKKTQKGENGGSCSSEASKTAGPASGSMASMMDEMAKTLARRRAQAENSQGQDVGDCTDKKFWEKQNSSNGNNGNSGLESPKSSRRQRIGSVSEENFRTNGPDVFDMERLKQEIMVEIRMEISKLKQDIIDAIRVELNRR